MLILFFGIDDGDNVLESDESVQNKILAQGPANQIMTGTTWALADSSINKFGPLGNGLLPNQTYYVGKAWCFGNLTLAPLAQDNVNNIRTPANTNGGVTCNGTALNNATQSDILNADVSFTAVQHRNNPNFLCNGQPTPTATASSSPTPTPTPTASPSPSPLACVNTFASSSFFNSQGTRKNGTAVLANRSVASAMFGAPQSTGAAFDAVVDGSFFSLGFTNGNIVLGFSAPFFNQPGADLQLYEVTGGPPYPDEKVKVEVANSSSGPWTQVTAALTKDGTIDINPIPSAQFVRLTDVSNIADFEATADGYDVDAIKALCGSNSN